MAATINVDTIITAIAALSVANWDICGLDNIPEQLDTRVNAVLFPDVTNLITDLVIEPQTWGLPGDAFQNADYTLGYVFAYKPVMAGRRITDYMPALVSRLGDLLETLATTDFVTSGGITVTVQSTSLGIVTDPAGTQYFGGLLKLRVMEYIQ